MLCNQKTDSKSEMAELDDSERYDVCSMPIRDSTDMNFVQPAPEAETLAGNFESCWYRFENAYGFAAAIGAHFLHK